MGAEIDWTLLALGLAGGLGLFLIGMDQMTQSLKALTGHRLQKILSKLSSNRIVGASTGALATAALQSSSVTTVLTVGFVSAELFTLTQAASVIIGANLGTTITAQIIALDVAEYSLGLLAVGAFLWLFAAKRKWKQLGRAIASLGFVFFGLQTMSTAMRPLTNFPPVLELLTNASSPLVAVLVGAAVAALIQSSSATTGIVIVMSANGLVDLKTGIAIILGANIGTCVTALLAAIGKDRNSLRAALVHVIVNVAGALIWLMLLSPLTDLVQFISNDSMEMASPRQLANAHSLFNIINTVIFLMLLTAVVKLTLIIVPIKELPPKREFLDSSALETPVLGLIAVDKQIFQLLLQLQDYWNWGFVKAASQIIDKNQEQLASEFERRKNEIRRSHREIVKYLADLSHGSKDDQQSQQILAQLTLTNDMIHLIDYLTSSFKKTLRRRARNQINVKPFALEKLIGLQKNVSENLIKSWNLKSSKKVSPLIDSEREQIASRFTRSKSKNKLDEFIVESDLLEMIERVNLFSVQLSQMRKLITSNV